MCAPHGPHIPVSRGFSKNGGGLLTRFFLSNVRIIGDPGAKTVLDDFYFLLQQNKKKAKASERNVALKL